MGMSYLRRYAVTLDDATSGSRKITLLPFKAGTNVFAASADWTPAAADFKICKAVSGSGLGAEANITNAPTWVNGRVVIILTASELTCRYLTIRIENAAIISEEIIVETYGHATLSQYPTIYDAGGAGPPVTSGTAADQIVLLGAQTGKVDLGRINGVQQPAIVLGQKFGTGVSGAFAAANPTNSFDLPAAPTINVVGMTFLAVTAAGVVRGHGKIVGQAGTTITLHAPLAFAIQNGDNYYIWPEYTPGLDGTNGYGWAQVKLIDADKITPAAIQNGALTAAKFAAGALAAGTFAAGAFTQVQTMIDNLNQSASRRITLQTSLQWERPEAGNNTYQIELRAFDPDGAPANATGAVTLTATGIISGDLTANLSAITNPATGVYRWTYTVGNAATVEQVRLDVSAVMADGTIPDTRFVQVCDFVAATWTAADRVTLNGLVTTLGVPVITVSDDIAQVAAIASGAKTSADGAQALVNTVLNRIGGFAGAGVNTILGFLKAIFSSSAATPSDMGGTGTAANNSLQAVRARGDAAWVTGAGGGGGGMGTGTGANPIDHDGGDGITVDGLASAVDILRYQKPDTSGADGLWVYAYLASEYDAAPPLRSPKGITRTGPDGRWVAPLMLDSGTYYIVADAIGDGYQAKINTVVVP